MFFCFTIDNSKNHLYNIINKGGAKMFSLSQIRKNDFTIKSIYINENHNVNTTPFVCHKDDRQYSRFFYILSGEFILEQKGHEKIIAHSRDLLYLPYDVEYTSHWTDSVDNGYIALHFVLNDNTTKLSEYAQIVTFDKERKYLHILEKMLDSFAESFNSKFNILSLFMSIFDMLDKEIHIKHSKKKYSTIYKGVNYIEKNFLQDISVDELSKMCLISPSTFRRLFKEYKGMSPISYRNYLRMKFAKKLLQSGLYNISQAASEINCYDLSYFNRLYKMYFNELPSSFTKEIKSQ